MPSPEIKPGARMPRIRLDRESTHPFDSRFLSRTLLPFSTSVTLCFWDWAGGLAWDRGAPRVTLMTHAMPCSRDTRPKRQEPDYARIDSEGEREREREIERERCVCHYVISAVW